MTTEDQTTDTEAPIESELDVIQSEPGDPFALSSGTRIRVERLRTRQTMALLKILTKGAGDVLAEASFSSDMKTDEFIGIFIGSVILSVPEAEDETIDFVRRMVLPEHYIEHPRTKAEIESNKDSLELLWEELENPELEDLIEIVERIVRVEAPHILALGKRIAVLLKVQSKSMAAKKSKSQPKSKPSSKASVKS